MCFPEQQSRRRKLRLLSNIVGNIEAIGNNNGEPESYVSNIHALHLTNPGRRFQNNDNNRQDQDGNDNPRMARMYEHIQHLHVLVRRAQMRGSPQDEQALVSMIQDLIHQYNDRPEPRELVNMMISIDGSEQMQRLDRIMQGADDDDDDGESYYSGEEYDEDEIMGYMEERDYYDYEDSLIDDDDISYEQMYHQSLENYYEPTDLDIQEAYGLEPVEQENIAPYPLLEDDDNHSMPNCPCCGRCISQHSDISDGENQFTPVVDDAHQFEPDPIEEEETEPDQQEWENSVDLMNWEESDIESLSEYEY